MTDFVKELSEKLVINQKDLSMKKSKFIELINAIEERDKKLNELEKSLGEVVSGLIHFNVNEKIDDAMFTMLMILMDDKYDYIHWYLYDNLDRVINIPADSPMNKSGEDYLFAIETPEDLYDFIKYFA